MVTPTRIYKGRPRRLFLREHRKALKISATTMAGRLGIERESVLRWEREPSRVDAEKQAAYAVALGHGIAPEDLWRPPGAPSLDGMIATEPPEVQRMAADIVKRLVTRGG